MIFIYEPQKTIPPDCPEKYEIVFPLLEACNQYRFLYNLDLFKEIDEIYFIHNHSLKLALYKTTLLQHSADIKSYSGQPVLNKLDEFILFPKDFELEDRLRRELIERLIQKQKFIKAEDHKELLKEHLQEKNILIYLPFKRKITNSILQNVPNNKRLKLFTNSEQMKINSNPRPFEVESKLYLEIDKKLRMIVAEKKDNYTADIYNYKPKSFLEIFNDTLLNDLNYFRLKPKEKRAQINGEDSFLAKRVINHLLRSETPYYFDLLDGIPPITPSNIPIVIFNFHIMNSIQEYKKLYDLTTVVNKDVYIILQSAYKKPAHYFNKYHNIELPDKQNIESAITSIFISFLLEIDPTKPDYYKLKSVIDKNSFLCLFEGLTNLGDLYLVFDKLNNLNPDDLLKNTAMWYFIISELKRLKREEKPKTEHTISFNFKKEKVWEISIDGVRSLRHDSLGIKYLAIISLYYQYYQEGIYVSDLRRLAYALDEKPSSKAKAKNYDKNYDAGSDYDSVHECLSSLREISDIDNFYTKYFHFKDKIYSFSPAPKYKIKITSDHPKMTKLFFDPYHADRLPRHHKANKSLNSPNSKTTS